jgi:hypothetical protein
VVKEADEKRKIAKARMVAMGDEESAGPLSTGTLLVLCSLH